MYRFDLPVDYLTGEAINGHVQPVALLPFHYEIVL